MNHFCIGSLVCNIDSKFTSGHYSYDLSKTKIENVATVFRQKLNCRGRPPGEGMLEYITVIQTIKITLEWEIHVPAGINIWPFH